MLAVGLHGNGMFGRRRSCDLASSSRRPTWKHMFFIRDRLRNTRTCTRGARPHRRARSFQLRNLWLAELAVWCFYFQPDF